MVVDNSFYENWFHENKDKLAIRIRSIPLGLLERDINSAVFNILVTVAST